MNQTSSYTISQTSNQILLSSLHQLSLNQTQQQQQGNNISLPRGVWPDSSLIQQQQQQQQAQQQQQRPSPQQQLDHLSLYTNQRRSPQFTPPNALDSNNQNSLTNYSCKFSDAFVNQAIRGRVNQAPQPDAFGELNLNS